jgi:hypothetical protein
MRELIDLITLLESQQSVSALKKTIAELLKTTDESSILNKVLKVLQAGNIDERVADIVGTDQDAKQFLSQITEAIIKSDANIEEKNEFLKKFPKGILDVKKLVDGSEHSFEDLVGPGFPTELFINLSVSLTSQGVGPGEVALAVLSPSVKWSGRVAGGGDILVNGKAVEVKTRVSSGGRWLNTRKSNMNLPAIKEAIEELTGYEVPARLSVDRWVNEYRPLIDKKELNNVSKIIADGIFNGVPNTAYKSAIAKGSVADIIDEHLRTGFNNYKKLSGFEGVLLMDIPLKKAQYFTDYDSMKGVIKNDAVYIYGPESEMMPKVSLIATKGDTDTGSATPKTKKADKAVAPKEKDFVDTAAQIATGKSTSRSRNDKSVGVGRNKRK